MESVSFPTKPNATINRELATLKCMFNLGTECTPPKVRVLPHIPMLKESSVRQGFVEDAEFSRLATETSELWLRTFLELGFTYGWRHSELLGLRVRQVNVATGTIRLDPGTTKNGEGREVTMTAKVSELLRQAIPGKVRRPWCSRARAARSGTSGKPGGTFA